LVWISIVGGFVYSDVDCVGMSVFVVYDVDYVDVVSEVIEVIVVDIVIYVGEFVVVCDDVWIVVVWVLVLICRLVFLVDVVDNIGGGSFGDGMVLLCELLVVLVIGVVVMIVDW